jgi:hypothetical protein
MHSFNIKVRKHACHGFLKERKKKEEQIPRANYTDRATAACQRSDCQLLRKEGATWSV